MENQYFTADYLDVVIKEPHYYAFDWASLQIYVYEQKWLRKKVFLNQDAEQLISNPHIGAFQISSFLYHIVMTYDMKKIKQIINVFTKEVVKEFPI